MHPPPSPFPGFLTLQWLRRWYRGFTRKREEQRVLREARRSILRKLRARLLRDHGGPPVWRRPLETDFAGESQ